MITPGLEPGIRALPPEYRGRGPGGVGGSMITRDMVMIDVTGDGGVTGDVTGGHR